MKELKENLTEVITYQTADTLNHEDFPAWTPDDKTALDQMAMTGTLGNSFYANAKEQTEEAVKLLEKADAKDLAEAIVKGRQEGFIRAFPILGLVYLSMKSSDLFKETFQKVILTGNDLADFIDMAHKVRGMGRSIKAAIWAWLDTKLNPYYAMKYRTAIADAIRVSRYKGTDPLCAFVLNAYNGVNGVNDEKITAAEEKYPELAARKKFIELIEAGRPGEAAQVLKDQSIDTDGLTAWYDKFDTTVWTEVAKATPVMKFLKYLAKFQRERVNIVPIAEDKITVENLKKAKVFPFRLFTAWLSIRGNGKIQKILAKVMDDYTDQYDWEVFDQYSWVIAPDISGSMWSPIGASSILTFSCISGMFTGFFAKGLKDVTILPWHTEVAAWTVEKNAPVMEQIIAMCRMCGGGTYMEAAVKYLLEHQIKKDFCVFLTDTEEYGGGWLTAWNEYRKFHPQAQAFLLRADSYQTCPIFDQKAKECGIWQIFGWNDNVLSYMKNILMLHGPKKV